MDTSEQYIKMCEGAPELELPRRLLAGRRSVPWFDGDMIALNGKVFMYSGCDHSEGFIEPDVYDPACIWLPRQDQLQEMVWDKCISIEYFCPSSDTPVWNIGLTAREGESKWYVSAEQAWLAFVQKELYNKVWNGDSWTSI